MSAGVLGLALGDPLLRGLPDDSPPRAAYAQAAAGLAPGVISEAHVIASVSKALVAPAVPYGRDREHHDPADGQEGQALRQVLAQGLEPARHASLPPTVRPRRPGQLADARRSTSSR